MQGLFLSIGCALLFGTAPLMMRFANMNVWSSAIMVTFGSVLAASVFLPSQYQNLATAGGRNLAFGIAAGILNGIGLILFYKIVVGSQQGLWQLSNMSAVAYALTPIAIAIGSYFVFHEPITVNKLIGVAFAAVAIWFLNH